MPPCRSGSGRPNLYATVGTSRPDARVVRAPRHRACRRRLDARPVLGRRGRRTRLWPRRLRHEGRPCGDGGRCCWPSSGQACRCMAASPPRRRRRGGGLCRCQEGSCGAPRGLGHRHRTIWRPGSRDRQRAAQSRDRLPRQGRAQLASRGRPERHPRRRGVHLPRRGRDPASRDYPLPGIGPATYSVGLVKGGRGGSTVADRCELTLDRRVLPSEDLEAAENQVRALLGRLGDERPGLRWDLSRTVCLPTAAGNEQRAARKGPERSARRPRAGT